MAAQTQKPKRPLVKVLPVNKIALELSEDQRRCDARGSELTPIGEKFLRQELNVIPGRWRYLNITPALMSANPVRKQWDTRASIRRKPSHRF